MDDELKQELLAKGYHYKTITPEELDYLINVLELRRNDIGEIIGCCGATVSVIARRMGIKRKNDPRIKYSQHVYTEDELRQYYIEEGRSAEEVAEIFGTSAQRVYKFVKQYGLTKHPVKTLEDFGLTREILYQKYVLENIDAKALGKMYGTGASRMRRFLEELGIKHQDRADGFHISYDELYKEYVVNNRTLTDLAIQYGKSPTVIRSEILAKGIPLRSRTIEDQDVTPEVLEELYSVRGLSQEEIAEHLGVSLGKIQARLKRFGIEKLSYNRFAVLETHKDDVLKWYLEDREPATVIAEKLDTYAGLVVEFLHGQDIEVRRWKTRKEDFEKYLTDYKEENEGMLPSIFEVADYFKIGVVQMRVNLKEWRMADQVKRRMSEFEYEWYKWLRDHELYHVFCDHAVLGERYEVDFLLDDFNVGLEVNPSAIHNVTFNPIRQSAKPKTIDYHQEKSLRGEEREIDIIHIFDWFEKEKLYDIINSKCYRNQSIYARNLDVYYVSLDKAESFFEQYHLLGYQESERCIALLDSDGSIRFAMSFKHFESFPEFVPDEVAEKFESTPQWELVQFASQSGYTVIGGVSRAFAHFIREFFPESIITYGLFNISKCDVYVDVLGFDFMGLGLPECHWVEHAWYPPDENSNRKGKERYPYYGIPDGELTVEQLREKNGDVRIYDAGRKVFFWHRNSDKKDGET